VQKSVHGRLKKYTEALKDEDEPKSEKEKREEWFVEPDAY
jgi:hypothetical protein